MSTYSSRANKLRRGKGRGKTRTPEERAARSATKRVGKDSELWQQAYELKLIEIKLNDRLKVLKDVVSSVELNKKK